VQNLLLSIKPIKYIYPIKLEIDYHKHFKKHAYFSSVNTNKSKITIRYDFVPAMNSSGIISKKNFSIMFHQQHLTASTLLYKPIRCLVPGARILSRNVPAVRKNRIPKASFLPEELYLKKLQL